MKRNHILRSFASVTALLAVIPAQDAAPKAVTPMRSAALGGATMGGRPVPDAVDGLLQAGASAPDFVSKDAAGKEVRLADFKDKVVILDFWATWCQPCQQAMPHVQELAKEHASHGVVALAVCTSDNRAKFDEWVAKNQEKYPNVIFTCDLHDRGSATFDQRASSKLFHVSGLPTKFVIGKDRKITASVVGYEEGDVRVEAGLARAGLAIDAAIVAKGEAQAAKAAAEAAKRAREAAANPAPLFQVQIGKTKSGDAMSDFAMSSVDGKEMKLSTLKGKPILFVFCWPDIAPTKQLEELAQKYSGYGVQVVALFVHATAEDHSKWVEQNGDKHGFLTARDPVGKLVLSGERPDPKQQMEHASKTLLAQITGGPQYGTPAFPFLLVADAEGHYVGHTHNGARAAEAIANLLLRAGVKLSDADMPKVVAKPADFVPAPARPAEPQVPLIQVGTVAPDFEMQELDGKTIKLSDWKGKVVVVDFWATWCGPCKEGLPHTQALASQYKEQGVVVIASCTSDERAKFEAWVRENGAQYPDVIFAHDANERGLERASRKHYGVSGIPAQFVIDRDGKVAAYVSGYRKGEVLLDAALAKAGVKVDAETLAKAAEDQKKRDEVRR